MNNYRSDLITRTVNAAVEIMREKPHLKYKDAIEEAKKRVNGEIKDKNK